MNTRYFTDDLWTQFEEEGYVIFGDILSALDLRMLQARINAIMLGEANVDYTRMMMQLDSTSGNYKDAGEQTQGHKGKTLNYRKIQQLEFDPQFLRFIQHPAFREACGRVYGEQAPVTVFRSMFMNKPANRGTFLPWHQDRWSSIEPDPQLTIWTALDPATKENGCVQIIPGSHKLGIINPEHPSGFLTPEQAAEHAPAEKVFHLELQPGETALLHNHVLHASDRNNSAQSRRAFSVCYMHGETRNTKRPESFSRVFGPEAMNAEELVV